ncbi:MAG: hypothetical protein ACKVOR_10305 [Flavobacteriales bacterium]
MKITFTLSLMIALFSASAQQIVPNAKVLAAYTQQELAAMNNEQIDYLNFLSDNLCILSENVEKAASLPLFAFTSKDGGKAIDPATFNALLYMQLQAADTYQYYRIGDTNWVVFVNSASRLEELYARYKASNKN